MSRLSSEPGLGASLILGRAWPTLAHLSTGISPVVGRAGGKIHQPVYDAPAAVEQATLSELTTSNPTKGLRPGLKGR